MQDVVNAAKAEFLRSKGRLVKALETTPDDRINWSPSPTSRTPIAEVVHSALSIRGMMDWFSGKPFQFESMAAMDAASRAKEAEFSTREAALEVLETNSDAYVAWLEALTPEQVESTLHTAMGDFPMAVAITFAADHLRCHCGQIDYIQTIYGDLDWHMG